MLDILLPKILTLDGLIQIEVTDENAAEYLADVDGILVPGGFGFRASEGKISAIKYARENNVPFFGICLECNLQQLNFQETY